MLNDMIKQTQRQEEKRASDFDLHLRNVDREFLDRNVEPSKEGWSKQANKDELKIRQNKKNILLRVLLPLKT